MMRAAIVIPAFNEEKSIEAVVAAVRSYGTPVVVDDGSADQTGSRAAKAGAEVVRQDNAGYDAALAAGFRRAEAIGADMIVTIDADGQLDAGSIPLALRELEQGRADMALGVRDSGAARWSEGLFNAYARLRFGVPDILCGLKAFRTDRYLAHRACMDKPNIFTALALALLRRRTPFSLVPVAVHPRVGEARFGNSLNAELRIVRALCAAVGDEMMGR
jgi:glycosyltransferase involved in cell wall biosynthesis